MEPHPEEEPPLPVRLIEGWWTYLAPEGGDATWHQPNFHQFTADGWHYDYRPGHPHLPSRAMRHRFRMTPTGFVIVHNSDSLTGIHLHLYREPSAALLVHEDGRQVRLRRISCEQELEFKAESAKWEWPGNAIFGRSKSPSSAQPA